MALRNRLLFDVTFYIAQEFPNETLKKNRELGLFWEICRNGEFSKVYSRKPPYQRAHMDVILI